MPVAHVRVLVSEPSFVGNNQYQPAVLEVAPWSDPYVSQLLVNRGFRMPLADMLARYEDPQADEEPFECYFGEPADSDE